jgi:nucleoside-diphosphate-sugar epimerase
MKRVLLTGASGFIGFQAAPLLREKGYEVHAVSSRPQAANTEIRWHQGDLLDPEIVKRLIADVRPSHLLHLAWYAEPGKYWTDPLNVLWAEASLKLAREFRDRGGQRAVMAGSCAEYDWNSGACDEISTPLKPATTYGRCKHATQVLLEAYSGASGLSSAWGRVFYLYGPRESAERLVPSVVRSLLSGVPAQCTTGEQSRDFLHVEDVACAFVMLLESDVQGPVNIASGRPVRVRDLITEIASQVGRADLLRLGALPRPANDPQTIWGNAAKLTQTGWSPRYGLANGVRQTIEWWKGHLEKR